jgi:hypothetical protein
LFPHRIINIIAIIGILTKFSSVTIEKWQAQAVTPAITEENAWIASARKLKALKPDLAVYVWMDSIRIYTSNHTLNPDAKATCATGNFGPAAFLETHPEYLLRNTSGMPALEAWSHCHIYDFQQEHVRQYWTDMCRM